MPNTAGYHSSLLHMFHIAFCRFPLSGLGMSVRWCLSIFSPSPYCVDVDLLGRTDFKYLAFCAWSGPWANLQTLHGGLECIVGTVSQADPWVRFGWMRRAPSRSSAFLQTSLACFLDRRRLRRVIAAPHNCCEVLNKMLERSSDKCRDLLQQNLTSAIAVFVGTSFCLRGIGSIWGASDKN